MSRARRAPRRAWLRGPLFTIVAVMASAVAAPSAGAGIAACSGMPATIVGSPGNDVISATPGVDVISAGRGDDTIWAGGGNDIVCAGPGSDFVFGGTGRDRLVGGDGRDVLAGQRGRDEVRGGGGHDVCSREAGDRALRACESQDPMDRGPLRMAFYYGWFPEAWDQGGPTPYTQFHPTLGSYASGRSRLIDAHVRALRYGRFDAGIASWWGPGTRTARRLPPLIRRSTGRLRWAVYYEREGQEDPSSAQIIDDLASLRSSVGAHPAFLRIHSKFVVFVYADPADGCGMADRWDGARDLGAFVVLKVFDGFRTCPTQPDGWHQYSPATAQADHAPDSFAISPGFWKADEAHPRLTRDLARWRRQIRRMVSSGARFQLVTTFNEWGEGTAVESADEWATPSGFGAYLDALHRVS